MIEVEERKTRKYCKQGKLTQINLCLMILLYLLKYRKENILKHKHSKCVKVFVSKL